jgi:hypothetical protein
MNLVKSIDELQAKLAAATGAEAKALAPRLRAA